MTRPDQDGWDLWLTDLLSTSLGNAAAAEVELAFYEIASKLVARIDVGPAAAPVFARRSKADGGEAYLGRINSSTRELSGTDALKHQRQRW